MQNKEPACGEGDLYFQKLTRRSSPILHPTPYTQSHVSFESFQVCWGQKTPALHTCNRTGVTSCMAAMPASLTIQPAPLPLPRCPPAHHRSCQPGTCKTPKGHTSCLEWAFVSGSKLITGSGVTRRASGLWGDFRGLPTRYNAIITMDENRRAKNTESIDYQLVPVLQHPGPRKGKGLTQGHTTTWRRRLGYSALS